jgi:hypothetical protein
MALEYVIVGVSIFTVMLRAIFRWSSRRIARILRHKFAPKSKGALWKTGDILADLLLDFGSLLNSLTRTTITLPMRCRGQLESPLSQSKIRCAVSASIKFGMYLWNFIVA